MPTYPLLGESASYNMSQGLPVLFRYVNDVTDSLFMKMLLFSAWCIICIGSYMLQKKSVGIGDFPVSFTVASFIVLAFALMIKAFPATTMLIDGISIAVLIIANLIGIGMIMIMED